MVRARQQAVAAAVACVFGCLLWTLEANQAAGIKRVDVEELMRAVENGMPKAQAEARFLTGATDMQRWRVFKWALLSFSPKVMRLVGDFLKNAVVCRFTCLYASGAQLAAHLAPNRRGQPCRALLYVFRGVNLDIRAGNRWEGHAHPSPRTTT